MSGKVGLRVLVGLLVTAAPVCADTPSPSLSPLLPPVEVRAGVDRAEVTIGTPIKYTLEVRGRGQAEVVVPVLSGNLGAFAITDFGEERGVEDSAGVISSKWYKLVAYSPGNYVVPGPAVQYRLAGGPLETASANDVTVTVRSLVAGAGDPAKLDIRPIKQPIEVPLDWRPFAAALVLVAGVALAGGLAYRWANRRHFTAPAAAAAPPPHQVALEALARLRAGRLVEEGRLEEYYVQLSSIVRRYLEGRFALHAPEMTTEEFLQTAQASVFLRSDHRRLLGDFLTESDLVKFARYAPAAAEAQRAFEAARRFVEESRSEV